MCVLWVLLFKKLQVGSFFEHVKLTPKQVFLLSYYWCYEYGKLKDKEREIRTTSHPIVRLEKYFRKVCRLHFRQHPPTIGGPGTIVEVDETCVFKAKYNRGRRFRRHVWLFGGIERGSGRCFLSIVKRRDASTLLRLVAKYIRPGTTVISDCWRAYNSVSALPQAYRHLTVNHRFNFVNPLNGAHTQNVESLWQKLKSEAKRCYGINNPKYKDYLKEFMWRRQFGGQEEILFNFWDQIAQLYPLQAPSYAHYYVFFVLLFCFLFM